MSSVGALEGTSIGAHALGDNEEADLNVSIFRSEKEVIS